jgi:hypothetical protein
MMARSQITVDREMLRQARARASELGISFAEYLRRLMSKDLNRTEKSVGPSIIFGLGNSGGSDIARDKDRFLGEAWAGRRVRKAAKG